ncbi:auxin-induced protein X10A-like [Telopea speciosissima]|uniref:auxin-induced protein X10A-like n=1 Tax=Telopea speciosissima TaxID=54955 RepID=UPI001CC7D8F2|nr:auxin-induced protein X10A-like [Telopea speciosissima]
MAKTRILVLILRLIKKKMKRSLSLSSLTRKWNVEEEMGTSMEVPQDVKEGQFVVLAVNGGKSKRFVVDLGYLTHPEFLKMLQQAEEEFGFEQLGAIALPCPPHDLQRILQEEQLQKSRERTSLAT